MLREFGHRVTTCCDMLGVVGSNVTIFKTFANNTQHVPTAWPNARNMLRPTMLQYVALTCFDRLVEHLSCQVQHLSGYLAPWSVLLRKKMAEFLYVI